MATTEIYTYGHTLSLPDALPISGGGRGLSRLWLCARRRLHGGGRAQAGRGRDAAHRARAAAAAAAALLGRQLRRPQPGEAGGAGGGNGRADAAGRAVPHGGGRAFGRVPVGRGGQQQRGRADGGGVETGGQRSEEHTSELQSL